jgi:hypothetical protein
MSAGHRNLVRRSGFTIAYQDLCSRSEHHWRFWFGLAGHYQSLPTRTYKQDGVFGLVTSGITKAYQVPDLGLTRP